MNLDFKFFVLSLLVIILSIVMYGGLIVFMGIKNLLKNLFCRHKWNNINYFGVPYRYCSKCNKWQYLAGTDDWFDIVPPAHFIIHPPKDK